MELNPVVDRLSDRIRSFLKINRKVEIVALKKHLECKETELLLAIGQLMKDNEVIVMEEGWKTIISSTKRPDEKK
ncbi:hypothetical protein ACFLUV_06815 [Elusimicrobiota bacterium]